MEDSFSFVLSSVLMEDSFSFVLSSDLMEDSFSFVLASDLMEDSFSFVLPSDLSRKAARTQSERSSAAGQSQGPSVKTTKASCSH